MDTQNKKSEDQATRLERESGEGSETPDAREEKQQAGGTPLEKMASEEASSERASSGSGKSASETDEERV